MVKEDKIIFGSYDHHVYCLEVETGKPVWRQNIFNSSILASPVVCGDYSVVSFLNGGVALIRVQDGEVAWKTSLGSPIFSSPAIVDKKSIAIANVKGEVHCLNLEDGSIRWTFMTGGSVFSSLVKVDEEECLLLGCHDCKVYCIDSLGKLRWTVDHASAPVFATPTVVLSGKTGRLVLSVSTDGKMIFSSLLDGSVQALFDLDSAEGCFSSPVVYRNKIILGSRNNFLDCFTSVT